MKRIIIIGAGVGGLTTAAVLSRAGLDVTVLEAHVYPGGCAGTFFHQGYRFDAGATLAGGFYPGGPMDLVAKAAGIDRWPLLDEPDLPAMDVYLPDGRRVSRWMGTRRHDTRRDAFGEAGDRFFRWQESAADALWALALRNLPWPPQTPAEAMRLAGEAGHWFLEDLRRLSPAFLADAFRPAAAHLRGAPDALKAFVDAQLLISAQATSTEANALYAAAALDLPRRGVVHLKGGMGAIADRLVEAVRKNGGKVIFRRQVTDMRFGENGLAVVETKQGETYTADVVIANLTPWNIARMLGERAPKKLRQLPVRPDKGWGAFMVYAGIDETAIPEGFSLHNQVVPNGKLGEGNTVFLSLSPAGQPDRAPLGRRALTISTHTQLAPWWQLFENDREAYEQRKQAYADKILAQAEKAIPGLRQAADLVLPGSPVTFQRFTRRHAGWVGGFPQTSLFQAWGPRIMPGLWMVGDSIFPGQSTAAVALGGLRVAKSILLEAGLAIEGSHQRNNSNYRKNELAPQQESGRIQAGKSNNYDQTWPEKGKKCSTSISHN